MTADENSIFHFSKKERRSLIVLMALVFILQLLTYISRQFSFSSQQCSVNTAMLDSRQLDSFLQSGKKSFADNEKYSGDFHYPESQKKFKNRFFKKDTNHTMVNHWKDKSVFYRSASGTSMQITDVNLADSAQWESLKGIGPVLAGRIVRYRNKLGGFVSCDQLLEVYGFRDTLWQTVKKNINLKEIDIEKIQVNQAGFEVLANHPYIGFRLARSILAYRKQHGPFKDSSGLLGMHQMDVVKWMKLKPYLQF